MVVNKTQKSILIANALEHYDTAIYALLTPFFAPIFFPDYEQAVQLILGYGILASTTITKPIGSFIFGMAARKKNVQNCLALTLLGVAISTSLIGFLPGYNSIGIYSPIILLLLRMSLGIFSAGETTIAGMFILENKNKSEAIQVTSYYQSCTVSGIILASLIASIISYFSDMQNLWRVAFILSSLTGFFAFTLRVSNEKKEKISTSSDSQLSVKDIFTIKEIILTCKKLYKERTQLTVVSILYGFSYMTYAIPFVFLNSFVPLVSSITFNTMISLNTALLVFDMLAIPILAKVVKNFQPKYILLFSSITLGITILPAFTLLENCSFLVITLIRTWIIICGLIFLCGFNIWLQEIFKNNNKEKYLFTGIGNSIGSPLLGKTSPALGFALWYYTGQVYSPAYYIMFICFISTVAISLISQR